MVNWKDTWEEVKRKWLFFLLFGVGIIIINTVIQVSLTNIINSTFEGPPCRIDVPVEEFSIVPEKSFKLPYLLINLRDKDLLIESIDSYCYWNNQEQNKSQQNFVFTPPSVEQISEPNELDGITSSKSEVKSSFCRSPDKQGRYKVNIVAQTTEGECVGEVIMNVIGNEN